MNNFIQLGRTGKSHIAFYVITCLAVVMAYSLGQTPLYFIINKRLEKGLIDDYALATYYDTLDPEVIGLPSFAGLALVLTGHVAALLAFLICIRFIHHRPVREVITASRRIRWGRIIRAFGLWLVLSVIAEMTQFAAFKDLYRFEWQPSEWIPLFVTSLVLIPLQTSFEEIFMRGYLLQGIGVWTGSAAIAVMATSLLFMSLHMANPEVGQYGFVSMGVYYLSVAIVLALLTLRDNGLEYAMGIHAATNVFGAVFVSVKGSVLNTAALVRVDKVYPWYTLAIFLAMAVVFYKLVEPSLGTAVINGKQSNVDL